MVDLLEISGSSLSGAARFAGPGFSGPARSPAGGRLIDGGTSAGCPALMGAATAPDAPAPRVTGSGGPIGELGGLGSSIGLMMGFDGLSGRRLLAMEPTNMAAPAKAAPKISGCRTNGRHDGIDTGSFYITP